MGTIPTQAWGAAAKPGTDSQTGCVWCLIAGSSEPVDIIYFWGGTSLCLTHLPSHAKAHPLPTPPPVVNLIQGQQ